MSSGNRRRQSPHPRRAARLLALGALLVVVAVVIAVVALASRGGSGAPQTGHRATRSVEPTESAQLPPQKLLGQLLIGSFAGTVPSRSLLKRIETGQLGGVILFADNTSAGLAATRALAAKLQQAASEGGNPPLLIMTDQEGGEVRRLPGAPAMNADAMTSAAMARSEGAATGKLLRSVGINLDLAPIADVASTAGSFLGPRAFSTDAAIVGARACAFAAGLASTGVGYTLKHFPGLGLATTSTDLAPVTLDASPASLEADWDAYRRCGDDRMAMVMVSSAIYPDLTGPLPAVESPQTYAKLLPEAVTDREPPTISDDLQAGALKDQPAPALHALQAGLDMAMYASTEDGSKRAFTTLLDAVRSGLLSPARLTAAEQAVAAFKRAVTR